MDKIVLNPVTNTNSLSAINSNFQALADELQDKVFYRDNPVGEPNTIQNTADMDGNDIINVGVIRVEDMFIDGLSFDEAASGATGAAAAQAVAAASAAALSKDQAQSAALSAATNSGNAAAQASAAGTSATNAQNSAVAAAASAASIAGGPVASVAGLTGTVTSAALKTATALNNVDNTSDATKFANTPLTGVPTAPTAAVTVANTQVATTAFVKAFVDAFPILRVRVGVALGSNTSGTSVSVPFSTVDNDTISGYNAGTGRYTPNRAGWYQVNARIGQSPLTGTLNYVAVNIRKNTATEVWAGGEFPGIAASVSGTTASALIYCNGTTDYIDVSVFGQTSGSANWSITTSSFMHIHYVRGT